MVCARCVFPLDERRRDRYNKIEGYIALFAVLVPIAATISLFIFLEWAWWINIICGFLILVTIASLSEIPKKNYWDTQRLADYTAQVAESEKKRMEQLILDAENRNVSALNSAQRQNIVSSMGSGRTGFVLFESNMRGQEILTFLNNFQVENDEEIIIAPTRLNSFCLTSKGLRFQIEGEKHLIEFKNIQGISCRSGMGQGTRDTIQVSMGTGAVIDILTEHHLRDEAVQWIM